MRRYNLLAQVKQADPLYKAPLVELAGGCRVLVENHLGVLAYATEEISIKVKFGNICIQGAGLCLCELSRDQLVITGSIYSVVLKRR